MYLKVWRKIDFEVTVPRSASWRLNDHTDASFQRNVDSEDDALRSETVTALLLIPSCKWPIIRNRTKMNYSQGRWMLYLCRAKLRCLTGEIVMWHRMKRGDQVSEAALQGELQLPLNSSQLLPCDSTCPVLPGLPIVLKKP